MDGGLNFFFFADLRMIKQILYPKIYITDAIQMRSVYIFDVHDIHLCFE